MDKSHLTNEESRRVFDKVIKARKHRKGRVLRYQEGQLKATKARMEQKDRSKKFWDKQRELIKDAPKVEGGLLTEKEALGTVSWWRRVLKYYFGEPAEMQYAPIRRLLKRIWHKAKEKRE